MKRDSGMKCRACHGDGDCPTCRGSGACQLCDGTGLIDVTLVNDVIDSFTDLDRATLFNSVRSSWCLECGRPAPCHEHPQEEP